MTSLPNRDASNRKQRGVVSIEFAIGFFAFWLMVAAWAEMSYISYVSAMGDYAISEASREAKKDTETYVDTFKSVLSKSDSVWSNFVSAGNFSATVHYVKDLSELYAVTDTDTCLPLTGEQTGSCGTETNSAIAIYYLSYEFNSIFGYFFDASSLFTREVIVVQEYERDQFQI